MEKPQPKLDEKALAEFQAQLEGKAYRNVLDDLVAFTGFSKREICARAIKKVRFGFGAKGWFNEEFAYFDPRTPAEYDWFYRAGQIYLFSNARKAYWKEIDVLGKEDQPILDYGAGIGQNVLELHERGLTGSWYLEIGALQAEFFKFRMRRHGHAPKVVEPFHADRFDPVGCLDQVGPFRTIVAQDVLEHAHNYPAIARALVDRLEPGGKLLEHSPFARVSFDPRSRNERSTRVHLTDKHNLRKILLGCGMRLAKATVVNSRGSEVRLWRKQ